MHDETAADSPGAGEHGRITIKKYANRRLYNTATSCYVTLDYLSQLVKGGADFAVYDAKTGEDITRSVLTHIIVEEEAKGQSMLPVSFLRNLISFYGDSLQVVVPRYLEQTMHAFTRNQEQIRSYFCGTLDGLMPFASFDEMGKQQLALFDQAMRMFAPFYSGASHNGDKRDNADGEAAPSAEVQIAELRAQLDKIKQQLDSLVSDRNSGS
ncbi:MAG: polyhydroxyalkanoate synthesis repressor PhaR [Rhodospirillales bacterium]